PDCTGLHCEYVSFDTGGLWLPADFFPANSIHPMGGETVCLETL
ncbi:uncharacterized protein METZ01_LOCUS198708, partial [marine metagenome]